MNWCWMSCYTSVTHGSVWIAVVRALIDSIVYLSYLSFPVISNATHFICAVIWVCWLSFLDSSSFSYRIHVISFLCGSMYTMSPIPWLWCYFVIDSFTWLFDIAACILWYPDFTPCCDVVPFWSNADSVVLDVCVSACGLLGGVPYVAVLEVHAVSLINSWCIWKVWTKVIGSLGVEDGCVVVVRSVCMSC